MVVGVVVVSTLVVWLGWSLVTRRMGWAEAAARLLAVWFVGLAYVGMRHDGEVERAAGFALGVTAAVVCSWVFAVVRRDWLRRRSVPPSSAGVVVPTQPGGSPWGSSDLRIGRRDSWS